MIFILYLNVIVFQRDYEIFNTENTKLKKNNNCVICLGMLEEKVIENAKQQVTELFLLQIRIFIFYYFLVIFFIKKIKRIS